MAVAVDGQWTRTGGGSQVDGRAVLPGLLLAHRLRHVDLEELHTAELEPALVPHTDRQTERAGRSAHCLIPCSSRHLAFPALSVRLAAHLHEVASARGTQARQQGTRALGSHHLPARHTHPPHGQGEGGGQLGGGGMKKNPDAARQQAMYTWRAMCASECEEWW